MTSLSTLILIPAADPGCVSSEARQTGTGEAAHIVGAGSLDTTVGRPVEESVVQVTLVNVRTLGLVQAGVAHHPRHTVGVVAAAHLAVTADSVERVAVSVAAVVRGAEPEPGRVVGVLRHREVPGVQTEIVYTRLLHSMSRSCYASSLMA